MPADDNEGLADFQENLTRALNEHGVPAMPSWQAAIDWLAEHGGRSPQDEDHEEGRQAARKAVSEEFRRKPNGWSDQSVADAAIAAYLSRCPSAYRELTPGEIARAAANKGLVAELQDRGYRFTVRAAEERTEKLVEAAARWIALHAAYGEDLAQRFLAEFTTPKEEG